MQSLKFLMACLVLGVSTVVVLAQPLPKGERMEILGQFEAKVANVKKPNLKGIIASEAKWKEVLGVLPAMDKLPELDFSKHFLLVSMQDAADPNRVSVKIVKDEKGLVSVTMLSTLIGYQPSAETKIRFYKLSREGVTGVRTFDPDMKKMVVVPLAK